MIILFILLFSHFGKEHAGNGKPERLSESSALTIPEESRWELRKQKDDVFIYQRWVEEEPGQKFREIYAETGARTNPAKLSSVISDAKYGTEWLSMANEYKILRQVSDSEWYAYSCFNPVPGLKFDLVTRNEISQNPENHSITIGITEEPDFIPEKEKYKRLSHFRGRWEFVATDSIHARIRYYMLSNTKPVLPRWVTDPIVFDKLEDCISRVKEIAEQL
jgi:hypothetical protein